MRNPIEEVIRGGWNPPGSEKNYRIRVIANRYSENILFTATDPVEEPFMGDIHREINASKPGAVSTVNSLNQFSLHTKSIDVAAEIESKLQDAGYSEQQDQPSH